MPGREVIAAGEGIARAGEKMIATSQGRDTVTVN